MATKTIYNFCMSEGPGFIEGGGEHLSQPPKSRTVAYEHNSPNGGYTLVDVFDRPNDKLPMAGIIKKYSLTPALLESPVVVGLSDGPPLVIGLKDGEYRIMRGDDTAEFEPGDLKDLTIGEAWSNPLDKSNSDSPVVVRYVTLPSTFRGTFDDVEIVSGVAPIDQWKSLLDQ